MSIILETMSRGRRKWPVPFIHLLNTTTRMAFRKFVLLIGAIVLPFILGIQCLPENKKKIPQSILVVVFD